MARDGYAVLSLKQQGLVAVVQIALSTTFVTSMSAALPIRDISVILQVDHTATTCPQSEDDTYFYEILLELRYAPGTWALDQFLTNSPSRLRASGNLTVIAAKPRRKCGGASKQSPGASRMPRPAAA
jgi:hypothetical protein